MPSFQDKPCPRLQASPQPHLPACVRGMLAQQLAASVSRLVAAGCRLPASGGATGLRHLHRPQTAAFLQSGDLRSELFCPSSGCSSVQISEFTALGMKSHMPACRMARTMHSPAMCLNTPYGHGCAANAALHGFAQPPRGGRITTAPGLRFYPPSRHAGRPMTNSGVWIHSHRENGGESGREILPLRSTLMREMAPTPSAVGRP
jgi:hypothetical protein